MFKEKRDDAKDWREHLIKRNSHPYFMWESISTTHEFLRKAIDEEESIKLIAKRLVDKKALKIFLTGCGTSYHLAVAGRYSLENIARMSDLESVRAFELLNYPPQGLNGKATLIAFSHSGASKAAVDAVKFAKEKGACTIAVTSTYQSPITKFADYTIMVPGREEKAGPKTRSYTAGLMVMYLLSISLGTLVRSQDYQRFVELRKKIDRVCDIVETILKNTEKFVVELAEKYKDIKDLFVVGGGPNYVTALEAAIKLKEASLIHAEAEEVEEMAHGPVFSLDEKMGVIAIAPPGKSYTRMLDIVKAANTIGSPTLSMVSEHDIELSKISTEVIKMPSGVEELFTPIPYIVPLQMLAYYIAVKKGRNPDWVRTEEPKYSKVSLIVFPPGTH